MGAKQAVGIVNRRDIAAADDPEAARDAYADEYRGRSTSRRRSPPPRATSTRSSRRPTRAGASTEALRTLEAVAHPAHGVRNIPL